ncbi:hypothetical protein BBJ28_00012025 [Nothophytophthora sp. Chile5]|nr:hypothetical protein BBJ28_00012025 [Nothophytophthora sp. Chile5]
MRLNWWMASMSAAPTTTTATATATATIRALKEADRMGDDTQVGGTDTKETGETSDTQTGDETEATGGEEGEETAAGTGDAGTEDSETPCATESTDETYWSEDYSPGQVGYAEYSSGQAGASLYGSGSMGSTPAADESDWTEANSAEEAEQDSESWWQKWGGVIGWGAADASDVPCSGDGGSTSPAASKGTDDVSQKDSHHAHTNNRNANANHGNTGSHAHDSDANTHYGNSNSHNSDSDANNGNSNTHNGDPDVHNSDANNGDSDVHNSDANSDHCYANADHCYANADHGDSNSYNSDSDAGNSDANSDNSDPDSDDNDSYADHGKPSLATVAAGVSFDGGLQSYQRSDVVYDTSAELASADAVFVVEAGGTLQNVIISGGGGVFCATNDCAFVNVWFEDSVQAAVVVNSGTGTTTVTGGGAKSAAQRVVFGQSSGTVVISGGFYMEDSAVLFESCSTCGPAKRAVVVDGVVSVDPTAELVRVNENYNDMATISNATIVTTAADYTVCTYYDAGDDPVQVGSGANASVCAYTSTSVTVVTA